MKLTKKIPRKFSIVLPKKLSNTLPKSFLKRKFPKKGISTEKKMAEVLLKEFIRNFKEYFY